MGESETVACAIPLACHLVAVWLPTRNQRRLRRMNGQTIAPKPFGQHGQYLPGLRLVFAADDEVIGKTEQKALALDPWLHHVDEPVIQDMMEEYIGSHRRDHSALRHSGLWVRKDPLFHHTGVPPLPDQP